jgi:hypothetical protein
MRTLSSATAIKAKTEKGTFPVQILEIRWVSGTKYYSELDYTFDGNVCEVAIIKLGEVSSSGKIGSKGEVSSIDFELDDTNNSLKTKINTEIIEGTVAVVWHHYYDLPSSDATIMHYGKLSGPFKWSEEARTFSGNIESIQGKGEIGFSPSDDENDPNYVNGLLSGAYNTPWPIIFGTPKRVPIIQAIEDNGKYTYIISLYNTSGVAQVLAKRKCGNADNDDLYVVPSSYYTVDSQTIGDKTVGIIVLNQLLSTIEEEGWSDDLWFDPSSGLTSNPISQISWILSTFTDLNIDTASFNTASAFMTNTPAHHVLSSQQDALPLCEKIAWQARCLLFIKNGTAYIRPLFINTIDTVISLNEYKNKSVELSFTDSEDIVTVFNAKWKQDYSGHKEAEQTTTRKNNIDKYGVISEDYDFFIYTTLQSVQIASSFWAYRYANSWRKISLKTFLPTLSLEAFDCVQFDIPILSTYALRGFAESVKHDADIDIITVEAELGSKTGDSSGGQPIEDPKYWLGGSENKEGYDSPRAARTEKLECEDELDKKTKDAIEHAGGVRIHIEEGSIYAYNAYEIYWMEKDVKIMGEDGYQDVAHVGTPRTDNIESGQILFTKENTVGYYGWGYPAGDDIWCDYNLNPDIHPNYFDSPVTAIGDHVGVKAGYQYLSKDRYGFVVTGIASGKVTVSSGSMDPKLEDVKSSDTIPAFSPAEIYGYNEGKTLVRVPTEDNLPPGRVMFALTNLQTGFVSKGYNAFDVSPFVSGDAPSAIGTEFGTKAGTTELVEGNTGFVVIGRKDDRNQFRPF